MAFKLIKTDNNYLSKVALIYVCINLLCTLIMLVNLLLLRFFTYDDIPSGFMDINLFLVICVYLYFRFHYVICPFVILCFLIEKIIAKIILMPDQSTSTTWLRKYLNVIFIIVVSIAIFFNVLLIHYSPDLLAGID